MRVGHHGGYCREIRHHAWQIETGSWWYEMHWLLWQKRGSPGPLHFRYLSAKNENTPTDFFRLIYNFYSLTIYI